MSFPVTISERALIEVRKLKARKNLPDAFLRVGVKGGGCSGLEYVLRLDDQRLEIDQSAFFDDVEIVCDSKSARFLEGAEVVYTGNLIGGGFAIENPNAARSCGCGTSFTPKA